MEISELKKLTDIAKEAALKAGEKILEVYQSDDFNIELKGDNSPLTRADKMAHLEIISFLEATGLPVLSEEGKDIPYEERKDWEYFWMVDPLDGTKEFIKRNDEFTVNIALIRKNKPVMGVVYAPVLKKLFWGGQELGAFMQESQSKVQPLPKRTETDLDQAGLRIVASRSHLNADTEDFLSRLQTPEVVSMGSSLKFMLLAEGKADVYPRFGPTMEWDTAAAHGVMAGVGAKVWDSSKEGHELAYNKENLLNPNFLVK